MKKTSDKNLDISPQDKAFLMHLGFIEDAPDEEDLDNEEDLDDEIWTSYYMEKHDHPYIDGLHISVNVEPGFITAYGREGEPFLQKPFTHENLLGIMKFLGFSVPLT